VQKGRDRFSEIPRGPPIGPPPWTGTMTQSPRPREDRLAAKLRENLRRRKAQARAMAQAAPDDDADTPTPATQG
jgi:hypothetical protein